MKKYNTAAVEQAYDSFHYTLRDFSGQRDDEQRKNFFTTLKRLQDKADHAAKVVANCNGHAKKHWTYERCVNDLPKKLEEFKASKSYIFPQNVTLFPSN